MPLLMLPLLFHIGQTPLPFFLHVSSLFCYTWGFIIVLIKLSIQPLLKGEWFLTAHSICQEKANMALASLLQAFVPGPGWLWLTKSTNYIWYHGSTKKTLISIVALCNVNNPFPLPVFHLRCRRREKRETSDLICDVT